MLWLLLWTKYNVKINDVVASQTKDVLAPHFPQTAGPG